MEESAVRLNSVSGISPDAQLSEVLDTGVIEAILTVPSADARKLLSNVVATFEEAVVGHLEAIDELKEPHQIILNTAPLARQIRSSAMAAGATGVADIAVEMELLVTSATGDVSRNQLAALVGQCYASLQAYLSLVFERYLVAH